MDVGLEILGAGLLMAGMKHWMGGAESRAHYAMAGGFPFAGPRNRPCHRHHRRWSDVVDHRGWEPEALIGGGSGDSRAGLLMAVIQGLDQRFASDEERW